MTNSPMKVKALSDWAYCWVKDRVFELHTSELTGYAYVLCNDHTNGPHHTICDHKCEPLTPADITAGKSDQFICI